MPKAKIVRIGIPGPTGGGVTQEGVRDTMATALRGSNLTVVHDDVADTITIGSPGRIDAKARGVSTADTDASTELQALVNEAEASGAELWLAEGVYNASISTTGNLRLAGPGTLRGVGTFPLSVATTSGPVVVDGLAFDGAGAYQGVLAPGTTNGLALRSVRVKNTGTARAVEFTTVSGLVENIGIRACTFEATCGGGVLVNNGRNITIQDNTFRGTTNATSGDFIKLTYRSTSPAGSGDGVVITGNVGAGCARMGLEIWSALSAPWLIRGTVIEGNWFDFTGGSMGMSIVSCRGASIQGNTLIGSSGYGIENVYGPNTITGNTIVGRVTYGVGVQDSSRTTVADNIIIGAVYGVYGSLNNTGFGNHRLQIIGNRIIDPVERGIHLGNLIGTPTGTWGADTIERNVIWRSQVEADDGTRTFSAIRTSNPTEGPHQIRDNILVQANASPTLAGLRILLVEGTTTQRSRIHGNHFRNMSGSAFGTAIHGGSGAPSLEGLIVTNNHFQNLLNVTSVQAPVSMFFDGNVNTGTPQNNNDVGLYGTSLAPADFPSHTAAAPAHISIRGHKSAAPVAGDGFYRVGDVVFNTAPAAGGFLGWVCITAGNPGVWKTWGAISA